MDQSLSSCHVGLVSDGHLHVILGVIGYIRSEGQSLRVHCAVS